MADLTTNASGISVGQSEKAQEFARLLGTILNNTLLYGLQHKVVTQAIERSYGMLNGLLADRERLSMSIVEGVLVVDGQQMDVKNPLIASLTKQLASINLPGFSIMRGMPCDEYVKLLALLATPSDKMKDKDSFTKAVSSGIFKFIQIKAVTYREITEDETVVSKAQAAALAETGDAELKAKVEGLVKALGSPGGAQSRTEAGEALREVAGDTDKLAEVIVRAAGERSGASGKKVEDEVLDCLQDACEVLVHDPSVKTQQGKKTLTRTLTQLESRILDHLRNVASEFDEARAKAIVESLEEMVDDLKVDAMAAEYVKKRMAIDSVERKLLKFIKKDIDSDGLRQRLIESGLSPEDWRDLLIRSGVAVESGKDAVSVSATMFASMLLRLEEALGSGAPQDETEDQLVRIASTMREQVDGAIAHAHQNLAAFESEVKAHPPGAGEGAGMSRARLMRLLAEIVQEICQPVAVMSCSIDMIRRRNLGATTPMQDEMLKLAAESAERVSTLLDRLLNITGLPKTMQPDARILKKLYE